MTAQEAVHFGQDDLPFVDIGDGSLLKVLQVKPEAPTGEWKLPEFKCETPLYATAEFGGEKRLVVLDRATAKAALLPQFALIHFSRVRRVRAGTFSPFFFR